MIFVDFAENGQYRLIDYKLDKTLPAEDAAAMVDSLGSEAERDRIVEAAEGNPLFVEQLAAVVAEGGRLETIPPTIRALLAARLDRLPAAGAWFLRLSRRRSRRRVLPWWPGRIGLRE